MSRRTGWIALALVLIAAFCNTVATAQAEPLLYIAQTPDSVRRGGTFRVDLGIQCPSLAAFVLIAEYDSGDIEQASALFSEAFDGDYTYISPQEGQISVVYTAKNGQKAPQDGRISFTFRTREDALSDTLPLRFTVTDAASPEAQTLLSAPEVLEVEPVLQAEPSSDSALLSLVPPVGQLVPAFDPEIYDYTLDVPFSSASLAFEATPTEGASVRVNRKNLGAGGSTVDFTFTVTAADGETKSIYTVAVTRLEKGDAETDGSNSGGKTDANPSAASPDESGGTYAGGPAEGESGGTDPASISAGSVQALADAQSQNNDREDRILTVGLTLLSVGFGAVLTVLLLRILPQRPKHENPPPKDENRGE